MATATPMPDEEHASDHVETGFGTGLRAKLGRGAEGGGTAPPGAPGGAVPPPSAPRPSFARRPVPNPVSTWSLACSSSGIGVAVAIGLEEDSLEVQEGRPE